MQPADQSFLRIFKSCWICGMTENLRRWGGENSCFPSFHLGRERALWPDSAFFATKIRQRQGLVTAWGGGGIWREQYQKTWIFRDDFMDRHHYCHLYLYWLGAAAYLPSFYVGFVPHEPESDTQWHGRRQRQHQRLRFHYKLSQVFSRHNDVWLLSNRRLLLKILMTSQISIPYRFHYKLPQVFSSQRLMSDFIISSGRGWCLRSQISISYK